MELFSKQNGKEETLPIKLILFFPMGLYTQRDATFIQMTHVWGKLTHFQLYKLNRLTEDDLGPLILV